MKKHSLLKNQRSNSEKKRRGGFRCDKQNHKEYQCMSKARICYNYKKLTTTHGA